VAYQDSIIIQYLNKGHSSKLAYSCIWNKEGLNALVCEQRTGINRAPYAKSMSLKRLLKIELEDIGLNDIQETYLIKCNPNSLAQYVCKIDFLQNRRFSFGSNFFFTQNKNSQKSYQLLPKGVNNFKIARHNQPNFLLNFGRKALIRERNFKISLLIGKMVEYIYSHNYQNYIITKRIAPLKLIFHAKSYQLGLVTFFVFLTISIKNNEREF
jgi:hypothetical protein